MGRILKSTVENKIKAGYEFRFGDYISEGFEIFKKEWVNFFLYAIVSSILLGIASITIIGVAFVLFPITLGFAVVADKISEGESIQFSDFFGAFKNIGQHFIVGLIYFLGYAMIIVPYVLIILGASSGFMENSPLFGFFFGGYMLLVMFFVVLLFLMQVLLFFAPFLIHFGDYTAIDAIKASIGLAKQNFWWLLLFVFTIGILSSIGQYACIIGVFATMPIAALSAYSLVKKELMKENHHEIDEIGSHI